MIKNVCIADIFNCIFHGKPAYMFVMGGINMAVFAVVFAYVASVVGAGFASGQEMISFFVRYGRFSILGIFISAAIFGLFASAVLKTCVRKGISNYDDFLRYMLPRPAAVFMRHLTFIFAFVCFCTMAAGSGAMGYELFGVSPLWGNIIMCAAAMVILFTGSRRAMKYNAFLGGVIVVGVISCCLYIMGYREHQTMHNITRIVSSAVSYAGYNLITSGVVLVSMSGRIKTEKDASLAGFVSAFVMLVIMFLMWVILSIYYGEADLGELPMLAMAKRQNVPTAAIYAALLFLSILTTAIASGEAAREISGAWTLPIMLVCAISLGSAGFKNMVNIAYRICGYAGLLLPFYVIIKNIKNEVNGRKRTKSKENRLKIQKNRLNSGLQNNDYIGIIDECSKERR